MKFDSDCERVGPPAEACNTLPTDRWETRVLVYHLSHIITLLFLLFTFRLAAPVAAGTPLFLSVAAHLFQRPFCI